MNTVEQQSVDALLRRLAVQYETADFMACDPSRFMHQVTGRGNQEAMAFIASGLSYGSRKQFFPKIERVLEWSGGEVSRWVEEGIFERHIPDNDECYYRLYSNRTMRRFLARLRSLLERYGSLGGLMVAGEVADARGWLLDGHAAVCKLTRHFAGTVVVPRDATSACKRLCMFLRWMVRDGSPVDLGLWRDIIDKRTLIMPLDTHVLRQSVAMGLLSCKSGSMVAAQRLTARMRETFPDDPLRGDFALFGVGVSGGV